MDYGPWVDADELVDAAKAQRLPRDYLGRGPSAIVYDKAKGLARCRYAPLHPEQEAMPVTRSGLPEFYCKEGSQTAPVQRACCT